MRLHIPSFLLLGVGGVNLLDGKFTFLESEMGWMARCDIRLISNVYSSRSFYDEWEIVHGH
jgi:hypothetical protein